MKQTRLLMGMPITVEVLGFSEEKSAIDQVYEYFTYIDEKFSTYKPESEISKINQGKLQPRQYSKDMKTILKLCEQTKKETSGYFDIERNGKLDPSGLVKGWAIYQAALLLNRLGVAHYFVEAGGDIQVSGQNAKNEKWQVGIRNPFRLEQIVKVIEVSTEG